MAVPLIGALTLHFGTGTSGPLFLYAFMGVLSFTLYGVDKYRANHGTWRLKESLLHSVDLMAGWPGGYAAQRYFRHKTAKKGYQTIFWATVMLHCALWLWLFAG